MKNSYYTSIGFTAFSACMLLGHMFRAYPDLRVGTGSLIGLLIGGTAIASLASLVAMRMGRGSYCSRADYLFSQAPPFALLLAIALALCLGVISA